METRRKPRITKRSRTNRRSRRSRRSRRMRSFKQTGRGRSRSRRKKRSKKRPQKKSTVSIQDYDTLQEQMLKMNESLPKPPKELSIAEIFRDDEVSKKIIGKYMFGPNFKTPEELDSDENKLLEELKTLQSEYNDVNQPKDDHLFQWGEKYSDSEYKKQLKMYGDDIRSAAQFRNKNKKALTEIMKTKREQDVLYQKMGLKKERDTDIFDDIDYGLLNQADIYLKDPEEYKKYLADLYDTDYSGSKLGRIDMGKGNNVKSLGPVDMSKHYQKLPPTLYPIEEGDDESVYGKEEDIQYYHPKSKVDEMISHYKLQNEMIPELKGSIKTTYEAIDHISDVRKNVEKGELDILKCNSVKKLAETDIHLYKDKEFKDKFIMPCSDNKLLTKVYISTFISTPINLKTYFLGSSLENEERYRQGGLNAISLISDVPDKYLSEWAKEDIMKIWYTMGIPEDYNELLRYFNTTDNFERFLDTVGRHLSSTIYLQTFKNDSEYLPPWEQPLTGLSMEKIKEYLNLLEVKHLSSEQKIDYYLREDPSKVEYFYNKNNHNYNDFNEFWKDQINKESVNKLENNPYIVDELKRIVELNPEESNKRLHHHDFDVERTKRYLILLFMGLVQNDWFIHRSNANMREIVNSIDSIIDDNYGREIMWSFGSFPNSSRLLSSAQGPEYNAKIDEVLAFNPQWLKGQAKREIEKEKEMLKYNKDYLELFEYFDNKLYPDGRPDSDEYSQ